QLHLPPRAIHIQHIRRGPRRGVEGGDEPQPACHGQGGCRDRTPGLLGFAALTVAGSLRRRGIELGGNEPDTIPVALPPTPPGPLPLAPPPLTQPAQHRERLLRVSLQRGTG